MVTVRLRRLDHAVDLDAVARGDGLLFVRNRVGVAGWGVAARIPVDPRTEDDPLSRIIGDAGEAGAAVAFAAVPFSPTQPYELIVAEVTVRRDETGSCWIIAADAGDERPDVDDAVEQLTRRAALAQPCASATGFEVAPLTPIERYLAAVGAARDQVRAGQLAKAVIAREILVRADAPIDVHAVLTRLRASFGSSYRYSVDGLVGASPELLVAVDGAQVRSHPLAGTAPRTGDPETDRRVAAQLVASTKDQIEHRIVIDEIYDTLLPWCSYLDWAPEPSIVTVANVQHLGTAMEGRLSQPHPGVLDLVHQLRPTPALGGSPRADALELIEQVEGFERGRYGGAVGWVDTAGSGTFAVTIRCAELDPERRSARLVAGGGIVADSDPAAELAETQAKFQAMLSAIVRP